MMKQVSIVLLTIFLSYASFACTCIPWSYSEQVEKADVIIRGTVISIDTISARDWYHTSDKHSPDTMSFRDHQMILVKFKTEKVYKSNLRDSIVYIMTDAAGTACGYFFESKQKYIVYSYLPDEESLTRKFITGKDTLSSLNFDYYETNSCTNTTWRIKSEEKLLQAELGRLRIKNRPHQLPKSNGII